MGKSAEQHILEKSALVESLREFLIEADEDLGSYGWGGKYEKLKAIMIQAVNEIVAVEPTRPLPPLPYLRYAWKDFPEGV